MQGMAVVVHANVAVDAAMGEVVELDSSLTL